MRSFNGTLLHAASDLNAFLSCAHAVALNLQKLTQPYSLPNRAVDDESMVLIQDAGHAHEAQYLEQLRENDGLAEIPTDGSIEDRAALTIDAMQQGKAFIYQATFLGAPWHGFADFLRRVDEPSSLGDYSYEVIDTKLARTASPKHVLQLALYSDMIESVQGTPPHAMHLVLGNGREVSFRTVEFRQTLAAAKSRYLKFVEEGAVGTRPEPCSACNLCGWREVCSERWEAEDHLSRVAGIQKSQINKLRAAGVDSVHELAALPSDIHIAKLAPKTFARLRAQAALQVGCRGHDPAIELLPIEDGRGFARMPQPDPHDLFFDLEGDPLHPDGLEYLWGVHFRDCDGKTQFRFEWAHDREAERIAFETIVDWFSAHIRKHPHAHIYHYAPYEVTVLRRLSTAFASREDAVDKLLRGEKFVDLYTIARSAIRTSEPDLSLKTLETFFAEKRSEGVQKADQSIVYYHRWKDVRQQSLLDDILAYNKVDCENTEGLRNWLLRLRPNLKWWSNPESDDAQEKADEADEREARREALRQAVRRDATILSGRARELLVHLIDFHERAKKPEKWAIFDRCKRDDDELIDDGECIGDIRPIGSDWTRPDKRSTIATYSFPPQESKLRKGSDVLHAPTREKMGAIYSIDQKTGVVEVRRGVKAPNPWPQDGSLIPGWPIKTDVLEEAVQRVARSYATFKSTSDITTDNGVIPYQALADIIERTPPRLNGWEGSSLVVEGETLIEAASRRALALNHSYLFIQGPPGTGKTHTSAHVILSLIAAGKKIGVSSNSHKAINNLLRKIEEVALEKGVMFSGVKKSSKNDPDTHIAGRFIVDLDSNEGIEEGSFDLIGGTAWLFARSGMNQKLDYLFIDEAGQVSLGHLLAMGSSAKNIIMVGDQMQLSQPIQGTHPGESGQSALDYLLQGAATIAPDRGILLDTSWRMHPKIQSFISNVVYDGRLKAHPDCARQTLLIARNAEPLLIPQGIRMVPMDHEGCSQSSEAEVERIASLLDGLLGQGFIDRNGKAGVIGLDNILVVAPFNLQVNALKARLPEGCRVGTVDKFQGQEAEVVIVSLTTSSPDDLPRHVDFFYSKNRINVAISRARTLAIVLANPKLLELDATTVEHLRLVNTLAWLHSEGEA